MKASVPDPTVPALLAKKREAEELDVGVIEQQLRELIKGIEPEADPSGRGRPRILPSMVLWTGLLLCVLRGFRHQSDIWRQLSLHGVWDYPRVSITDQAVYNRLKRRDDAPQQLFDQVSQALRQRLEPYALKMVPWAKGIYAIDATTLDKVAATLPALRAVPPEKRLPGKVLAAFDVRLQQFAQVVREDDAAVNDKRLISQLLPSLPPSSLLLLDLGFFSFELFDTLTGDGFFWVTRLRSKSSFKTLHVLYEDPEQGILDAVIFLGAHTTDRAAHAVRLVKFRIGDSEYSYLTNVLDPKLLSLHEIAGLYQRRWDIELAFLLLKRELALHFFFSAQTEVVWHQVFAALTIAQVLQAMRLEIAGRAEVSVDEVSMNLLVREAPQLAKAGRDPVEVIVAEGKRFGVLRPSRRLPNRAPQISQSDYIALPDSVILIRKPRYAKRRCQTEPGRKRPHRNRKGASKPKPRRRPSRTRI